MKVILLADVKSLGKKGEVVEVSDGYAKNFLFTKKLGIEANGKNMNDLKLQKANDEKVAAQNLQDAKDLAKIIGTVGQLQFEVIQYRLLHEYGAQCRWEPINLYKACWIESDDEQALEAFKKRKYQFMAVDKEGRDVFLADSGYVLQMAQQDFPKIKFHFTSEF